MKISVIITSFNYAKFIRRAIESCLNQSYKNYEIWVIDGASKDNTVEILKSYGDKINWISEPDSGEAEAMNKGLKLIQGDIVNFLCADNYFTVNAFETVVDAFKNNPNAAMIYSDLPVHNENCEYKYIIRQKGLSFNTLLNIRPYMAQPVGFIKKNVLDKVGEFNTNIRFANDHEMWLRILKDHNSTYVDYPLAIYIEHEATLTKRYKISAIYEAIKINHNYGGKIFSSANKFYCNTIFRHYIFKLLHPRLIEFLRKKKNP